MEKEIKYYFYRTENLINGKFYYGVRHSEDPEHDPYLGSGLILKEAVKKHGKENFKKTILEYFPSMEEAYVREAEIVNDSLLSNPKCYNIKYGGRGGFNGTTVIHKGSQNRRVCRVALFKFLEAGWEEGYSEEHGVNVGKGRKGYRHSEETKRKIGEKSRGRVHSEEARKKMSESSKGNISTTGMIWVTNESEDHHIWLEQLPEWQEKGYRKGRKKSSVHGLIEYNNSIRKVSPGSN